MKQENKEQDRRVNITVTHQYQTDRFGYFVRNFILVVMLLGICLCFVMIVLVLLGLA